MQPIILAKITPTSKTSLCITLLRLYILLKLALSLYMHWCSANNSVIETVTFHLIKYIH